MCPTEKIGVADFPTYVWNGSEKCQVRTHKRESVPLNSTDRIANRTGNFTASSNGGEGGSSQHTLNTFSSGSDQIQFSPGSGQTLNRNFNIPITNPYLTINYIIRAGVGSSQIG